MRPISTLNARFLAAAAATLLAALANPAHATFHLWQISQVYSNASGTVQYIQFQLPASTFDDERFLTFATVTESKFANVYPFPSSLPSMPSPSAFFLVATPGYAALPGVPAPDYVLPVNKWFDPAGDTLTYAGGIDTVTFASGQLPTDGTHALFQNIATGELSTANNFITNFSGATGTIPVPEPASLSILLAASSLLIARRRR